MAIGLGGTNYFENLDWQCAQLFVDPEFSFWDDSGTVSTNDLEAGDFYHAN